MSVVGIDMIFSGMIPRPGTRLGLPTPVSVTDPLRPPGHRLVSLCQVYLNSGVFAVRNVPFLHVNATQS